MYQLIEKVYLNPLIEKCCCRESRKPGRIVPVVMANDDSTFSCDVGTKLLNDIGSKALDFTRYVSQCCS